MHKQLITGARCANRMQDVSFFCYRGTQLTWNPVYLLSCIRFWFVSGYLM